MVRTLERDQDRMYALIEQDNGDFVLNVVVGGVGMYEVAFTLNADELARYQVEGKPFIDELARDVSKNSQSVFADRVRPA